MLDTHVKNGVRTIKFNNPKKKNAISIEMYDEVSRILNQDATNDEIVVTIITGTGEYFTSGNNISMDKMQTMTFEEIMEDGDRSFREFVRAFLDYPKLLIAVVNGPAIGIGVTMCALCDITYASDTATFQTPFVKLALCIEGCASYLMPRIMGRSKATELLLLGHKLDAEEALRFNLISKIVPKHQIERFIEELHKYGKLPVNRIIFNKKLITDNIKDCLCECDVRERERLTIQKQSPEFLENIMSFMNRKSKL